MKVANKYFDVLNFKGGIIMLCQNCNKNEATVRYTEIINGEKIAPAGGLFVTPEILEEIEEIVGIEKVFFEK